MITLLLMPYPVAHAMGERAGLATVLVIEDAFVRARHLVKESNYPNAPKEHLDVFDESRYVTKVVLECIS